MIQQSVTDKDNADQWPSSHLQAIKYNKHLSLKCFNLTKQHFSLQNKFFVKCNICNECLNDQQMVNLEQHIVFNHIQVIDEIRNEIRRNDLSSYHFKFDVGYCHTRCIINNCLINIFLGIDELKNHWYHCLREKKETRNSESTQRNNIDLIIEQSVTKKDNVSTYANDQQSGAHLQAIECQKELPRNTNLVWLHFIPQNEYFAECKICGAHLKSEPIANLKNHLAFKHSQIIDEIRKEIRPIGLSPYFEFDAGFSEARCTANNCIIDIFDGINILRGHWYYCHNKNKNIRTSKRTLSNNTDAMIQQSIIEEDNACTNAGDQRPNSYLQIIEHKKEIYKSSDLIWRYFSQEDERFVTCIICDERLNNKTSDLIKHIKWKHVNIIHDIQEEIKCTDLSQFVKFNGIKGSCVVKCAINDCIINIFRGIDNLRNHLYQCNQKRNNTNIMLQRSVTEEDNTGTYSGDQQSGANSQATKYQKLSHASSLIWRYFNVKNSFIKCNICGNICGKYFSSIQQIYNENLEEHINSRHTLIIERIRQEIKCTDLAPYFAFDMGNLFTRCIINNCIINIFEGISVLRNHLYQCRNKKKNKIN